MWAKVMAYQYPIFWVTDKVKNEDLTIEYCPTEVMVADFFTKPLQGAVFRKFREVIMGVLKVCFVIGPIG